MHDHLLPPGVWQLDAAQSRIGFAVRKLGFGTVRGRFAEASAEIAVEGGTSAGGAVRAAGIDTGSEDRDEHLRGFFAVDEHPEIAFAARRIEPSGDDWEITGALVIRGVAREVTLTAHVDPARGARRRRRLHVRGEIDRHDFGLSWSRAIEKTGVVGSTVRLELDLEFECVRKPARARRAQAAAA